MLNEKINFTKNLGVIKWVKNTKQNGRIYISKFRKLLNLDHGQGQNKGSASWAVAWGANL